jgi:hypothetical protein
MSSLTGAYENAFKMAEQAHTAEKSLEWDDAKFYFATAAEAFLQIMAEEIDAAKIKVLRGEISELLKVHPRALLLPLWAAACLSYCEQSLEQ